jgi:hypothetical protein
MNQFPLAAEYPIGTNSNVYENLRSIHNFVFISGISDNGNKLFTTPEINITSVVVIGGKLLQVSLTLEITPCPEFSSIL